MKKTAKKALSLFLCALLCISLLPVTAFAENEATEDVPAAETTESAVRLPVEDAAPAEPAAEPEETDTGDGSVAINETNFPDAAFREYISTNRDTNADGLLSPQEINSVTSISCNGRGLTSLEGVALFPNLASLDCANNQLTTLDVSSNTALQWLDCDSNQLTALDVSGNTALEYLWCGSNQLTALDVSSNTALQHLGCNGNQLTALDVSRNTTLQWLTCGNNQLTALDVSHNAALVRLWCGSNQLTALDVSRNTALEDLQCYDNQLTALDVSSNTALLRLLCANNQLTELDVSGCASLAELECADNRLTALDLSGNTNLGYVAFNGQSVSVPGFTQSGEKYLFDLSSLVGAENTGKISSVENGEYDPETGIASFDAPDSFTYNYSTGYGNTLMDVTCKAAGLEKLTTPTNLKYGFKYKCQYDESWNYTGYETVEAPGVISWCSEGLTQNEYMLAIYKAGEETPVRKMMWRYFGREERAYSVEDFIRMDPESGEYYFTVTALGDATQYSDSDTAVSETWTYVKPELSLGQCSKPVVDGRDISCLLPEDLSCVGGAITEIYCSSSADMANSRLVGETCSFRSEGVSQRENSSIIYDYALQKGGAGYYSVRLRALSCDINQFCNGPWSEMSDPVYISDVVDSVDAILQGIEEGTVDPTAETVREQVQRLDTESLRTAMLADNDNSGVNSSLQALEAYTGGTVVEVTDAMTGSFDAETVGVIGASLNDVQDAGQPVKLVLDQAKEEDVIPEIYDNTVAVRFSLELENVASTQMEVPVKVTLPIPAGINPDFLVILHYHVTGEEPEEIQPYIFQQDGQYYASFVLTSFSDFVMTVPATEGSLPGDANGDGEVNTMDLIRLMKYISGVEVDVAEGAGDVNGDGKVNTMDLIRLMKYINGEDVELH